ncbi:MAG: SRPBCC family protein [Jannaschia sp.]
MHFSASQDVAAPIDAVWACLTDPDWLEARVGARVADLTQVPAGPIAAGTVWTGQASIAGRTHSAEVRVTSMEAPRRMVLEGRTGGLRADLVAELRVLSPVATRLTLTTDVSANTLSAKLMLKTAGLAQGSLSEGYDARIARLGEEIARDSVTS